MDLFKQITGSSTGTIILFVLIGIVGLLLVEVVILLFMKIIKKEPAGEGEKSAKPSKKKEKKRTAKAEAAAARENKNEETESAEESNDNPGEAAEGKNESKTKRNFSLRLGSRSPEKSEEEIEKELLQLDTAAEKMMAKKKIPEKGKKQEKKPKSPRKKSAWAQERKIKRKAKQLHIPKTAQESIPYDCVYEDDGIIETSPGVFTKTYLLQDVNYQNAKQAEREEMFIHYGEFLNSFDPTCYFQITINQKNINMGEFEDQVLLKMKSDGLDELRDERNELLKQKMLEGKNNMVKEKYLTVALPAATLNDAKTAYLRLDSEIATRIKKIGGASASVLSTTQRLEILHDIYNIGQEGCFGNNYVFDPSGTPIFDKDKFSFEILRRLGLTTKDMIAPEGFTFKSDYGMVGGKYFRGLFLRKLPTSLTDEVLAELTNTEFNMLTSMTFRSVDGERALKLVRANMTNTNANMVKVQKQASHQGYDSSLISPELHAQAEETRDLLKDLTSKNQKLFYMTLVIVHFADSLDELNADTEAIQTIGRRLVCDIQKLSFQQENALNTALPLAKNELAIKRSLTTESAAVFMPFVNQELNDRDGGMYYGLNAISHNLVLLNRRNSRNGNGFILGTSGSGKSMAAKQEMLTVLLSSNDDVIVIDPEGEYYPMADMLGGEVIRIAAGADAHINPFDLDMNYDSNDDPLSIKSDFIVSLCESIVGERFGLTPTQRSIIDRCVHKVYVPFLESARDVTDPETGEQTKVYNKEKLPTFKDFYGELRQQTGYDALQLADGLEMYVTGSLNVFAHRTNVQYTKRFVVYDIKDIGTNMKGMGLLVVLDNIWNRIVEGRQKGKNVWFFIDEIYLLFKSEASAEFLRQLYKRARKYGGIPTGITQNVSDLLENQTARTMISNSDYIMMLNQAQLDRAPLCELLNISQTQASYISNANPGEGLIYNGEVIVPFVNKVPKNTKQYQAMTTKLSEVKERERRKELERAADRRIEKES